MGALSRQVQAERIAEEVIDQLREVGVNPVSQIAMYAIGDVVGLGLMTKEEFEEEAEYNEDGILVTPSGQMRALDLIPVKMRMEASKELLSYVQAKKQAALPSGPQVGGTVFYLPDNERSEESPPPLRIKGAG